MANFIQRSQTITCLFLLLILMVTTAQAQTVTTKISGKIRTIDGKAESGVTVVVKELNRMTTTKDDGSYTFNNIKPGNYTVRIKK
jgi:iron complex outermembrane receptor protein